MGPLATEHFVRDVALAWSPDHVLGPRQPEAWDLRSIVWSDMEQRDCHGNLCGPQNMASRLGQLMLAGRSTFAPIIGGMGAAAGALALTLRPGPRLDPAPGPAVDGAPNTPKGLKGAGPPFALTPLISIVDRQGGARFVVNW